jgi:hypothetical protein
VSAWDPQQNFGAAPGQPSHGKNYGSENQVNESNPANRRRSERVMLQMTVRVLTENSTGEQVEEQTQTLVVNAHGGLMKLKMEVLPGQPLILVNPLTKKEQSCRVVRTEQPSPDYMAVAFEFDHPAPGFWPVTFPPADWEVTRA